MSSRFITTTTTRRGFSHGSCSSFLIPLLRHDNGPVPHYAACCVSSISLEQTIKMINISYIENGIEVWSHTYLFIFLVAAHACTRSHACCNNWIHTFGEILAFVCATIAYIGIISKFLSSFILITQNLTQQTHCSRVKILICTKQEHGNYSNQEWTKANSTMPLIYLEKKIVTILRKIDPFESDRRRFP